MFDRKMHWGNVYQEKSPLDVSWYQKEPKLSLELIRCTQVASNEAIIDVGCGASVLVDHLCKECFTNLAVLDISENAIASAKRGLVIQQKALSGLYLTLLNLMHHKSFHFGTIELSFIS